MVEKVPVGLAVKRLSRLPRLGQRQHEPLTKKQIRKVIT